MSDFVALSMANANVLDVDLYLYCSVDNVSKVFVTFAMMFAN